MDKNELVRRIYADPDFIRSTKYDNSLAKFLDANPNGVSDEMIARLLLIAPEEVDALYTEAVQQLKKAMGIES